MGLFTLVSMYLVVFAVSVTAFTLPETASDVNTTDLQRECYNQCQSYFDQCKVFYDCRLLKPSDDEKPCAKFCISQSELCLKHCLGISA